MYMCKNKGVQVEVEEEFWHCLCNQLFICFVNIHNSEHTSLHPLILPTEIIQLTHLLLPVAKQSIPDKL